MYQDLGLTQLTDDLLWFERLSDHRFAPLFYFASLTQELAQFLGGRSSRPPPGSLFLKNPRIMRAIWGIDKRKREV